MKEKRTQIGVNSKKDTSALRRLPSIEEILSGADIIAGIDRYGRPAVLRACRVAASRLRRQVLSGLEPPANNLGWLRAETLRLAEESLRPSITHLINATGVLLHTNMGRAPLSEALIARASKRAAGYSNLELDLLAGKRGSRTVHFQKSIAALVPGKAGLVVNNTAAAVFLILNTLASGKEVIVSRGELVEIGGSFRIPDICGRSGARLIEVGTTNRTRLSDYSNAIGKETGLLLKVHPSNFRVIGFTEGVDPEDLAVLGRRRHLPVVADAGSGSLIELPGILGHEPSPADYLRQGYSLVCFSADKLMGSCQAGLILGKPRFIDLLRRNPLYRALRPDKLTIAILEETLILNASDRLREIPLLRAALAGLSEIEERAAALAERLKHVAAVEIRSGESLMGGGSSTDLRIPTCLVLIRPRTLSDTSLLQAMRSARTPVIARAEKNNVLIDLRTVPPEEDGLVAKVIVDALSVNNDI